MDGGGEGVAVKGTLVLGEVFEGLIVAGSTPWLGCILSRIHQEKLAEDTRSTHITCYNCLQIYNCKTESTKHI